MWLRRLPAVRRGDGHRHRRYQPLSAGRRRSNSRSGAAARGYSQAAGCHMRGEQSTCGGADRRSLVHRLHAVHTSVSGRCHRRCRERDAYRNCSGMHRLRTVHCAVSGGLHTDGRRGARRWYGASPARQAPFSGAATAARAQPATDEAAAAWGSGDARQQETGRSSARDGTRARQN